MLIRVDFNVPIENGVVADATRLERVLPTIRNLVGRGAKVVVLSHLGRPKGVATPDTSLLPVAAKMKELMPGTAISFVGDCVGDEAMAAVAALKPGEVAVLENVRYHKGEESNDPAFAKGLAALGDLYVDDAFSAAHRAHASIEGIANLLPSYAGLSLMAEIDALRRALDNPARPVMAIVGGAKVSTKIEVLTHLVARMDQLAVGGGMANTFLAANGVDTGASLVEPEFIGTAKDIMVRARKAGCEIVLPSDVVVAKAFKPGVDWQISPVGAVPADAMILDFGPEQHRRPEAAPEPGQDCAVEWPARRLRDRAVRRGHLCARPRGGAADAGGQARQRCRRRRHGAGSQHRRCCRRPHLCLDRGRRVPRMAWRGGSARGRGAGPERRPAAS